MRNKPKSITISSGAKEILALGFLFFLASSAVCSINGILRFWAVLYSVKCYKEELIYKHMNNNLHPVLLRPLGV